jgi:GTP-binding protein
MLKDTDFIKVNFEKSITHLDQSPNDERAEIAFAGRSNVGKSSLLNALFQRKNLVKTSSTPGKTQLINYFNVADIFYCVDLPGYGFARISKSQKIQWKRMIETYLSKNKNLKKVYLLIDSRHTLMQSDRDMVEWLDFIEMSCVIVLSKIDKLSKKDQSASIKNFTTVFKEKDVIPFSIKNKQYIKNLRNHIIANLDFTPE